MVGLVDSTTSGSGAVGEALEEACGLFFFTGRRAVYRRIYFFFPGCCFFCWPGQALFFFGGGKKPGEVFVLLVCYQPGQVFFIRIIFLDWVEMSFQPGS